MKALELLTFPRPVRPRFSYGGNPYGDQIQRERAMIESKRLTDAELAAEFYRQDAQCRKEQWIETVRGDDDYTDIERAGQEVMHEWLNTLHRFATLPHYDQEDQP